MRLHLAFKACTAVLLVLTMLAVLAAPPAMASDGQANEDWEFNLAPFYLWGISISGDITLGPVNAHLDVDFSDIFDNLSGAFVARFEATHKNKLGLFTDINYLKLSNDSTTSIGIKQDVELKMTLFELGGYYRVTRQPHEFDFLLGGRYVEIDPEIKLSGGPGPGQTLEGNQNWVDPFLGARWTWQFTDKVSLLLRGDIGGFGVGSDFAWHGSLLINWQAFKYAGLVIGYRALYMDYEDGSGRNYFNYDATIFGPIIGINFRW